MATISIVMDLPDSARYHWATVAALGHAVERLDADVTLAVVGTDRIDDAFIASPGDGVVMGPGTPYLHPDRAEAVVQSARERGVPLVGT